MPLRFDLLQHGRLFKPKRRRSTLAVLSALASESPVTEVFPLKGSGPSRSPFNRLPIELQAEIFTYCLSDFPRLDSKDAPFLIATVCKAWRSVVTSTPKLWSSFEIEVSEGSAQHGLHIEKILKIWLERSQNYPLSVRVIHIPVGRIADPVSERMLELLISEARRWRYAQFIIPTSNLASLRPKFPTHFPNLKFFSLQLKGFWSSEPSINILTINLPWHQLTSVDLQMETNNLPSLDDCLTILSKTERLRQCTISANCGLERNQDRNELHLPLLEDLTLILQGGIQSPGSSQEDAVSSLVKYLCLLSTPRLRTLDITWLVQAPSSWSIGHAHFISFLRQLSIPLRTLCISYLPVSEVELLDCLAQVPNVTDLHLRFSLSDLEGDPITNHFFSSLTVGMRTPPQHVGSLLPHLGSLSLQCNGSRLSHSLLLEMVQSRWDKDANPHVRFNHLRLLSMKPVLHEVQKRTMLWIDEGLDITVDTLFIQ